MQGLAWSLLTSHQSQCLSQLASHLQDFSQLAPCLQAFSQLAPSLLASSPLAFCHLKLPSCLTTCLLASCQFLFLSWQASCLILLLMFPRDHYSRQPPQDSRAPDNVKAPCHPADESCSRARQPPGCPWYHRLGSPPEGNVGPADVMPLSWKVHHPHRCPALWRSLYPAEWRSHCSVFHPVSLSSLDPRNPFCS